MGAGTSPADPASAGPEPADPRPADRDAPATSSGEASGAGREVRAGDTAGPGTGEVSGADETSGTGETSGAGQTSVPDGSESDGTGAPGAAGSTRRFPSLTRGTARPEGGGRAASGDAPAPARQWPLLTVLCTAGAGLLIVAADPFTEAFRVGAILMGVALLVGAVLRWIVPSVGMLAVRSRFTDLVTYGVMGTLIVLLALMAQPRPLLDVPILQDVVHFTIR